MPVYNETTYSILYATKPNRTVALVLQARVADPVASVQGEASVQGLVVERVENHLAEAFQDHSRMALGHQEGMVVSDYNTEVCMSNILTN